MAIDKQVDSNDKEPIFIPNERVLHLPSKMEATVIRQILQDDGDETFWGNVMLRFEDGKICMANNWQCKK